MSIFKIRAANAISPVIAGASPSYVQDGKLLGTVEAKDAYEAAVVASRKHFKPTALPRRETSWPGKSGVFSVTERTGNEEKTSFFYIETTS